ncbi:MAG: helicase, partial [Xanthobacteraceae bacterium]
AAVRRLQLIVETLKPRDHADLINRSEHDVIATRQAIMDVDQEVAGIARGTPGFADLPFDLVRKLVADSEAHAWFEDRPHMLLAETGLSLADVDAARDARIRLGSDLLHIDDEIPPAAQLPDPAAVAGMHQNLVQVPEHALTGPAEMTLPRRVVAALGIHGAGQLAADLEALAAAHRVIDDEPWLGPLSPLYSHDAGLGADVAALVDFARDATSQLSRRPAFLARPVETPADTFADTELLDIVERLAAGKKVFTAFARRERRRKPVIDSITVAGFAPADPDGWGHVRDYLAWRRTIHSLNARWRSLAPELGAPSLAADHPHAPHGFEWIVKSVDVAIVAAAIARRNVTAVGPKLMMSPGDVEAMLENAGELQKLAAAVRSAAIEIETSRRELARLNGLFAGPGVLAAAVRDDVLSRIGQDGSDRAQIRENWTRIRERIVSLQGRREDFERIRAVSNALAAAGAPILAGRVMTEAAPPATGDPVLAADWPGAWNWAVLTRRTEESGRDPHLRQLAERRRKLETTLREQLEAVIAARTRSGLVQNMSGPIRQALTIFTIALRNMEAAADGSAAHHHRRTARDALEGCCEGIPCWLVPSWRIAEQLPARFGAFDLVIVDEASRFDVCELTTLLRGRKILVIGDHSRAGPTLRDVDHAEMERIAETILRPLPKTIRPFMRPGSSLHDLVKVLFAGNDIQLEEQIRLGAGPVGITPRSGHARSIVLTTAAGGAHADEAVGAVPAFDPPPESPNEIMHSEADVIVGEIAKAVARLPRSNRQRRTGAVLADTADTADAAPSPASAIPATRPPQHVVASPPWLHDAPPGAGQRRSVSGRRVAVAAVAMLVMVVGATYWLVGPRANSRVAAGGAGPIPHELVPSASA